MALNKAFKWRKFAGEIILWGVRWYCGYGISYRDLQEMMKERGITVAHTTLYRWVQVYAPEINKRCRSDMKKTSSSWRVDETWIKIKGKWKYLYRAIDKEGSTLEFMLSAKRNKKAAKRFFKKTLGNQHVTPPTVIGVDKNPSYPPAFTELQQESQLPAFSKLRQVRYLNNRLEGDHRFTKRRIRYKQWFQTFRTAANTIAGYEAMHSLRKGQIRRVPKNDVLLQKRFIEKLFLITV